MPVTDVDSHTADLDIDRGYEPGLTRWIGVPINGMNRCNQLELIEYLIATDVSRVENELYPGKCGVHVRSNQPVRVGDQSDRVLLPAHSCSSDPHRATKRWGTPRWSSTRATMKSTRSLSPLGR